MCARDKCLKCYVVFLNAIMVTCGVAMLGVTIWIAVSYKGFGDMVQAAFVWVPLGIGLGMFATGLFGCCGAIFDNKCALIFYCIVNTALIIALMMMGIFLLIEVADIVKAGDEKDSYKIDSDNVQHINTYESVLYNKCCYNGTFVTQSVTECPCDRNYAAGCTCYNDVTSYNYLESTFDNSLCDIFKDLMITNDQYGVFPLVGATKDGGCGAGMPKDFQVNIGIYAVDTINPGAWVLVITSIVLLLGVVFACLIICKKQKKDGAKDGYQHAEDDKMERMIQEEDMEEGGIELQQADKEISFN
mmetsp:Transcript_13353/g.21829  ORF Transcript_13353/g.21829 Transcript_13353/m.21829 type:complete len:302 (-) Transcript_13353:57-962(-)